MGGGGGGVSIGRVHEEWICMIFYWGYFIVIFIKFRVGFN